MQIEERKVHMECLACLHHHIQDTRHKIYIYIDIKTYQRGVLVQQVQQVPQAASVCMIDFIDIDRSLLVWCVCGWYMRSGWVM